MRINKFFPPSFLLCPKEQQQGGGGEMGKTLTWSEGSHSDRFLQGRVEFSFSSQVPSKVQKRYTCPCSTARSKVSHSVSGRRACSTEGKLTEHLHTTLLPHPPLSCWRGQLQHGRGSVAPSPCLLPTLCSLCSGPWSTCQGIRWHQDVFQDSCWLFHSNKRLK